jgi:gamma-glutamyltranspeptidase/glutathione hydrolase
VQNELEFLQRWPDNQKYWLKPDGSLYKAGDTIKLPTLARTLTRMVEAERSAQAQGRTDGIVAARDRFYKGDIAREMVTFLQDSGAPFAYPDFADFFARVEEPAITTYRDYTVYKHGFGSQGPMLLQALNILETFDLQAMGYASADYLHTVVEAMKLAYADRRSAPVRLDRERVELLEGGPPGCHCRPGLSGIRLSRPNGLAWARLPRCYERHHTHRNC